MSFASSGDASADRTTLEVTDGAQEEGRNEEDRRKEASREEGRKEDDAKGEVVRASEQPLRWMPRPLSGGRRIFGHRSGDELQLGAPIGPSPSRTGVDNQFLEELISERTDLLSTANDSLRRTNES